MLLSYDECDNLRHLLEGIALDTFDFVIGIDPGSTDGTLDVYAEHEIPVWIQELRGRGAAFQLAASRIDTDLVIFFSTDGNEDPADLPRMLTYLQEGYEMVVAGRYLIDGADSDDTDDPFRLRKCLGILGGLIVRAWWGGRVVDAINGFRGFRTETLRQMRLDAQFHEIELQSTIRAAKMAISVKEFGTTEQPRFYGTYRASARTATLVWKLGLAMLREVLIGKRFLS